MNGFSRELPFRDRVRPAAAFGSRTNRDLAGQRILAVEDSPSARKLLQGVLLRLGVALPDLRFASDASEALQLFTQWRPDIVLLDIQLRPGAGEGPPEEGAPARPLNGDELARQLLERNPRLNLVLVTASDQSDPKVRALLARGAVDLIIKPVLAARVQEVLEKFTRPGRPVERRR